MARTRARGRARAATGRATRMERPAGERSERLFPDEVQCALDEACAGLRAELDALLGWVWVWRQVSAARAAEALAVGRDDGEAGASPVADSILSRAVTAVEDAVRLRHAGSTAWEALGTVEARSRFGESLPRLRGMLADLAAFLREWDEEWGQDGERGPRSGLEMYVKKVGEEHGTHCAPYAARRAVLRSTVLPWALTVLRAMAVVDEAWLGGEDSDGEEAAPVLDGRERDALERLLYELAKVLVAVTQAPSTLLAAEAMRELERCGRRRRRSTTMVTTGSGSDLEKDGTGNRIVAAVEVRDAMLELAEHTLHLKRVLAGGCSSDDDATHTALTFFTALLARSLTHQESPTREELLLMLLANAVRAPVLVRVSSTLPALPEAAHSTRWRAVLARDRQFTARIVRALADEGDLDGFRLLHIVAYRSCQQLLGASVGGDEREHHQHVVQLVTEVYAAAWARLASPETLATALEQDAGAHRRHRSGMSLPLGAQWQRERQRRQRQRRCEPARWNGRHGGLVLVKGRRAAVDAVQSTAQLAAERPEPRDDLGALDEDAAVLFYHPTRSGGAVNPKWMASAPSTTEAVDVGGAWETLGAEEEQEAAALVRALAAAWREWTDNARHASDSWMNGRGSAADTGAVGRIATRGGLFAAVASADDMRTRIIALASATGTFAVWADTGCIRVDATAAAAAIIGFAAGAQRGDERARGRARLVASGGGIGRDVAVVVDASRLANAVDGRRRGGGARGSVVWRALVRGRGGVHRSSRCRSVQRGAVEAGVCAVARAGLHGAGRFTAFAARHAAQATKVDGGGDTARPRIHRPSALAGASGRFGERVVADVVGGRVDGHDRCARGGSGTMAEMSGVGAAGGALCASVGARGSHWLVSAIVDRHGRRCSGGGFAAAAVGVRGRRRIAVVSGPRMAGGELFLLALDVVVAGGV
eukprot:ctg_2340.g507